MRTNVSDSVKQDFPINADDIRGNLRTKFGTHSGPV